MKNIFKKIKLIAVLLFTGLILGTNLSVLAVDKTIRVGNPTKLDAYISGTSFNYKVTTEGKTIYCINRWKNVVKNTTGTLVGEKDAGYTYIVANGYPYQKITGDKYKDYYITQSAIWWYMDELNGNNYSLSKEFKTTASDKYGLRSHIKKLVAGAKKARKAGYESVALNVTASDKTLHMKDENNFVSEYITVNTTGIKTYEVSITSAPQGSVIIDANGNQKAKFNAGEKFAVRVPQDKVTELSTDIKIKVSATGSINKVYEYKPSDTSMQNFITGYLVPVSASVAKELTLNISTSKVSIVKLDKATNKALAGAVLVLKNSDGKELSRWTSTTKAQGFKNLSNGTYTVEEISAPAGYERTDEKVTFTINNSNKDIKVVVYNEATKKEEPVKGSVTIKKLDKETKKAVKGAILVVKDSKGNVIETFTTTDKAYEINNLEVGSYTVEEESAPEGYEKSDEVVKFEINKSKKDVTVTFYNKATEIPEEPKPVKGTVKITKIDKSTDKVLPGAVLLIKDSEGTVIDRFTTTDRAYSTVLGEGTYTVEEESAPAGYKKSNDVITFTIDSENLTHEIVFENYPEVIVPNTSTSSFLTTIIGIIMIGSAALFVSKNAKKA